MLAAALENVFFLGLGDESNPRLSYDISTTVWKKLWNCVSEHSKLTILS